MGAGGLKGNQVRPATAQIAVQPAPTASKLDHSNTSNVFPSLNNSMRSNLGTSPGNSSDDTLKKPSSSSSRRSSLSSNIRGGSGVRRQLGSAKRFSHFNGTSSRPISSVSRQKSGRRFSLRGGDRLVSPTSGLPFQRDMDGFDFNESYRGGGRVQTVGHVVQDEFSEVILLRTDPTQVQEKSVTCCQLCGNQFTNLGIRVPLLLLCGHTYCSNCLEKACESYAYPTALKCGICLVITPLDQQTPSSLPQNEAILELIGSKEFLAMASDKNFENCAECEVKVATMYCSECSASYCDFCGKKAHEGSRVRAKHKPVSINLKPRPQPTCKKHPGQSCVLYCETEKQPMCVLCKFYNQHRFHKFDLMSKVASKYCTSVSDKLSQLEQLDKDLDTAAQNLYTSVEEVNSSARKAQDRLERHFTEMRKSYLASLERREAILLTLVDKQVEIKQEMIGEMRMEVAAARARVLAAREEAVKLLKLNPVTALLSRKHMDVSFDRALKQTTTRLHSSVQPDVPLSLLPDIMPNIAQSLNQHGAILQLPPKPHLNIDGIQVTANAISLAWKVYEQNSDASLDRTLTYSLHCYADVPFKLKGKLNFKRRLTGALVTPESGFEDMSDLSSESKNTFPSLPQSLLGSRNISLVAQHESVNQNTESLSHDNMHSQIKEEQNGDSNVEHPSLILKPTNTSKNIASLLPEPIRLPKPTDSTTEPRLPQLVINPVATSSQPIRPTTNPVSGAVLNLPPLIINKPSTTLGSSKSTESETELVSVTTSGVFGDSEDGTATSNEGHMTTLDEDEGLSENPRVESTTSTLSDTSEELHINDCTDLGRFCCGYAFEEIYCGERSNFHYTGLVAGASYYFRVRCHNAAGWGPWSDTVKCMTTLN